MYSKAFCKNMLSTTIEPRLFNMHLVLDYSYYYYYLSYLDLKHSTLSVNHHR